MKNVSVKYYKVLLVFAIISSAFSMWLGYRFGGEDELTDYYHLYSKRYDRTIYVSKNDTSSHLIWTGDTLTFQSK
jgi:hypothetical protein